MRRYPGLILLALLPIIGCNKVTPRYPEPGPPPLGGGGTGGGGVTPKPPITNDDPTKDWYTYSATDGSYSVKYPGKPDEKNQSTDTATGRVDYILTSYSPNGGIRTYSSCSPVYSVARTNLSVEKGLDGARDGAAKNTNSTITFEKRIDCNGIPGRELHMTTPKGAKAEMRIFLASKGTDLILYQFIVLDTDGNIDTPNTDLFLNSLDIKNPGQTAPPSTPPQGTTVSFEGVWSGTPQPGKDYVKVVKITKGTFPCEGEYETEWAGGGGFQAPVTWNLEGENLVGSQHNGTNTVARVTLYHGTLYGKVFTLMPPGKPGKQLYFEAYTRQSGGKP